MNKYFLLSLSIVLIILSGCSSLSANLTSDIINAGKSVKTVSQTAGGVDFKSGEVLCSNGTENDPNDMNYYVAKVLTQPGSATKNQAEVLFVHNGEKNWSSFVVPSHKATDAELVVGNLVFVLSGWPDYDSKDVNVDEYRQNQWQLARITSTDELFKKRVEINGSKYDPGLIRIPEIPLE